MFPAITMAAPCVLYGRRVSLSDPIHIHLYFEQILQQQQQQSWDDAPGLMFGSQTMSYGSLNQQANAAARVLASMLLEHYTFPSRPLSHPVIAIDIKPSFELFVALLAVLKLGAGYVPIDSCSAINRVKYTLNECKPLCVLVDDASVFKKETATIWTNHTVVDIKDVMQSSVRGKISNERIRTAERIGDGGLLSLIYTSGSTGKPKGVRLCHRTAMNRLQWQWQTFPTRSNTVGCFKTSLLFVDSIVEIFSCLLSLAPLVIVPEKVISNPEALVSLLEEHSVTRLTLVPSLLHSILLYLRVSGESNRLKRLTLWISNSETLPVPLLEKFFHMFGTSTTFVNLYGSTETMADVAYEIYRCPEEITLKSHEGNMSIGKPIFNSNIYLVDEDGYLIDGEGIGEICVSGCNVAAGYLDEGQNQNFSYNPFDNDPEYQIFYRSGDYAQIKDGHLIYEGRRDNQIKVRGQRVNIAEIEQVIQSCPNIDKVVVLYYKLSDICSVIVAYFTTPMKKPRVKMLSVVMEACRKSLPSYMIPKVIMVDEIPLQSHTRKVDQQALRKVYEKVYNRQSSMDLAVVGGNELKALSVLALNLSLPSTAISRNTSFFELGGNSVSMISTIVQLKEHGFHVPIDVFSQARSIQDILDYACGSSTPVLKLPHPHKYCCKALHEVPNNMELVDIIADSFVEKEPLDSLLGITKTEFLPFAKSLFEKAQSSELSLIILDADSGEIVGGDFLFDFSEPVSVKHHDSMVPIVSLFHHFEPIIEELRRSHASRLMLNFCLGVKKDLPHAEQVQVCHFIEHNVLMTAQAHGFVGVITNNTNVATQVHDDRDT